MPPDGPVPLVLVAALGTCVVRAGPPDGGGSSTDGTTPGPAPWDHDADRWLIDKARGGDAAAFGMLLRRHQDRVYRIALRILGNPQDAEDVTQDVAVQLWRVLATFAGGSTFSTWLYRIVVNRCLNLQRTRRARGGQTRPLLESDHPLEAGPEDRALGAARTQATGRAMAALPDEQRAVLVLYQVEGLSYREVASILNISEAAVRSRLARARASLLRALRDWQ